MTLRGKGRRLGAIQSGILSLSMLVGLVHAEVSSVTVQEINPDRSTLDPQDPNGASGGRVNHVAIARANTGQNSAWFAASEWGGLFRSTDSGATWKHLPGHVPVATWDVAVDPESSNRVYATSFYDGKVATRAGISVSLDAGTSWSRPPSATPPAGFCLTEVRREEPSAFGIGIDPAHPDNVYIGTNCGLAISNDRGVTWRFVDPTSRDLADDVWDVVVHHGGIIDLVGDDGHRRSVDGGTTWTGSRLSLGGISSIAASPDEADVLFVTTGLLIWQTADAGATWTELTNPSPQGRIPFVKTNQRAGANFDLWFGDATLSKTSCTTPAGGGTAPRCPSNAWADATVGSHWDMGDVAFDPRVASDACPLAVSNDGGVYFNKVHTSPACHEPEWEQPFVTPHALWLWDLSGYSYLGATNRLLFGRRAASDFRYKILDDRWDAFLILHEGGESWGPGNYPTAVATGDVDGDGDAEYVIGRRAGVNHRYAVIDSAGQEFATLLSGGNGWGPSTYTTSVATGDVDGDGLDEVIIGRYSSSNMRYAILDDAQAGFATLHTGGENWGPGSYTTAVAAGDVDGDGFDEVIIGRRSGVNMRYMILDDARTGFAPLLTGGEGWGPSNYTTAVATGDVDGDGIDEVIIGRRANSNMRYMILDDRNAGFALLGSGGAGWGAGNYVTALATGDVDGDGMDEVIVGRRASANMRYQILDDASANFAQITSGGSGWGPGISVAAVAAGDIDIDGLDEIVIGRNAGINMRFTVLDDRASGFTTLFTGGENWEPGVDVTAVAFDSMRRNRVDLNIGNQGTGTFTSLDAEALKPTWRNADCCESFEVPTTPYNVLTTRCCWSSGAMIRLYLRQPGMFDGAEVNPMPPGLLRGFRPTDDVALFPTRQAAVITTSGVFHTDNIASPAWTQLGAATTPAMARHITAIQHNSPTPVFYVQAESGDLISADTLWRYTGTAPGGTWQQVTPPGGVGGFSLYAVDPRNAQRIVASHVIAGLPPSMVITNDGGTTWTSLSALNAQLHGGGAFRAQVRRGPLAFTAFGSYPQPQLVAISPEDSNLMIAAGADSGVFVTDDGGISWKLVSDPIAPATSGVPHIPRAQFAHFGHRRSAAGQSKVDAYIGTRGRGVFRIRLAYGSVTGAGAKGIAKSITPKIKLPEDQEARGKPDPADDAFGTKKIAPKRETPGKPDPSDRTIEPRNFAPQSGK